MIHSVRISDMVSNKRFRLLVTSSPAVSRLINVRSDFRAVSDTKNFCPRQYMARIYSRSTAGTGRTAKIVSCLEDVGDAGLTRWGSGDVGYASRVLRASRRISRPVKRPDQST